MSKRCRKTKTKRPGLRFGWNPKIGICFSVILILSSLIVYVVQMNNLATGGYKIKKLENNITELKATSKELNDKILKMQSVQEISAKVSKLEMVSADQVEYLVKKADQVALTQ